MTTKNSPPAAIKKQADQIAKVMKKQGPLTRGDSLTIGVFMDDKLLKITIPMPRIIASSEEEISEWIAAKMREDTTQ